MAQPALKIAAPPIVPEEASERIWTAAPPSLAKSVDDYFHDNRFKTRSAAVRQLIEYGLEYAKRKERGMI